MWSDNASRPNTRRHVPPQRAESRSNTKRTKENAAMPTQRTAQEAVMHTPQVEIQVLMVAKKPATLAMFRQIPYRSFIDWEDLAMCCGDGAGDQEVEIWYPYSTRKMWGHINDFWDGDH